MKQAFGTISDEARRCAKLGASQSTILRALAFVCAGVVSAASPSVAGPAATRLPQPPHAGLLHNVAVFGTDRRYNLKARDQALKDKIGLLVNRRTRSVCSAFCVGRDLIATAGHCLFGTEGGRRPRLADFGFRLASQPKRTFVRIRGARSGTAAQNIATGSMALSMRPPIDATRDWALVRLSKPVCKSGGLRLSRRAPKDLARRSARRKIYHVSFHRDFPGWKLAQDRACEVRRSFPPSNWKTITRDFARPKELILHTCDTGGASSGSPLLIDGRAGPEVVGINVGTYVQSKVLMQNDRVIRRYRAKNVANTGVSTMAFLDTLAEFQRAEILASKKDVKSLQELLAERGYYRGKHDGAYGPKTRSAIAGFERAQGRPVTGLATQATLRRLIVLSAEAKGSAPKTPPSKVETGSIGAHKPTQSRSKR